MLWLISTPSPVPVRRERDRADEGTVVRGAFLCALAATAILAAGCSNDKPAITAQSEASSDAILQRDCASPEWKKENLGLWYSVCRKPVSW
jgi:hypothetical protein